MKTDSIYDALKCQLDNCKETTLFNLAANDSDYQKLSYQLSIQEKNYQQSVIDGLIELSGARNIEHSTLNYLAGLIDSQRAEMLFSVQEDQTGSSKSIRNFYFSILHPCAEPCESPETLNFWKQIQAEEDTLTAAFTAEQLSAFEELLSRRT